MKQKTSIFATLFVIVAILISYQLISKQGSNISPQSQLAQVIPATLTIDASAVVKSKTAVLTSSSLNIPANDVVYVTVAINSNATSSRTITGVSGTGLSFTKVGSYGNATESSIVYLYTAVANSQTTTSITATQSSGGRNESYAMMNVLVVKGADPLNPVGSIDGAPVNGTANPTTISKTFTPSTSGAWGWLIYGDWSAKADPAVTGGSIHGSSYTVSGQDTYALIKSTLGSTLRVTAPTNVTNLSYLYFEILPKMTTATTTSVTVFPWNAPTSIAAGQPLSYTLNWNGGPMDKSWTIFVHFIKNDNDNVYFNADFWPSPATTAWSGNVLTNRILTIPANTIPGTYKVMVGLYNGPTRVKLAAGSGVSVDGQDRYQVGTILVNNTQTTISNVNVTNITQTGATVNWTTDQSADSLVQYGLTTKYGSNTTLNSNLVTSHSQALSNLTTNTTYHFVPLSHNANGSAISGDYTFTTAPINTYTITVNRPTNGTITSDRGNLNCGTKCTSDPITAGNVKLIATANSDSIFSRWSGTGLTCTEGNTSSNCTFNLTADKTVTATFNSNPTKPEVSVTASDASAGEPSNPGTFTFTRTGGDITSVLTVNYAVTGSANNPINLSDYNPSLGTSVSIPAGATTVTKTVTPINDTTSESNETVIVTISANPTIYAIDLSKNTATVMIGDDDTPPGGTTLANCSLSTAQAAVNSASPGATIQLPACSTNNVWAQPLVINKGVIIRGTVVNGQNQTNIVGNMGATNCSTNACVTDASKFMINFSVPANPTTNDSFRITGINFNLNSNSGGVWASNSSYTPFRRIRIDHTKWTNAVILTFRTSGPVYGVVDSNEFSGVLDFEGEGSEEGDWTNTTFKYGANADGVTADNLYYEDNTFTSNCSSQYATAGGGGRYAFRYNNFTYNCPTNILSPWFDAHGNQAEGNYVIHATMGVEMYGNAMDAAWGVHSWNKAFYQRGGKALFFGNKVTTSDYPDMYIVAAEECFDAQSPPANNVISGQPQHVSDSYYWNNRLNGNLIPTSIDNTTLHCNTSSRYNLQENRDFYTQSTSFTGATGIGGGTTLPTGSCTDGVGFWLMPANTQSFTSINSASAGKNPTVPISGSLYKCVGGQWPATPYYTPLTYPHPIRTSGPVSDNGTTPSAVSITASAGANGTVTPTGVTTVNSGGSQTYTITPAPGYQVASVTVNNTLVTPLPVSTTGGTYPFTNVTANKTISATFSVTGSCTPSPCVNLNASQWNAMNGNAFVRGTTYILAPSTGYSGKTLSTSASGSTPITIKGSGTGQVVFDQDSSSNHQFLTFSSPYWVLDGITGSGKSSSSYGISVKLTSVAGYTSTSRAKLIEVASNNVNINHIAVQCYGPSGDRSQMGISGAGNYVTVSNSYIDNCQSNVWSQGSNWTVENTYFNNNWGSTANHDVQLMSFNNLTFRNNFVAECGSQCIEPAGGCTDNMVDAKIYNNVFANVYGTNGVLKGTCNGSIRNAQIYGNTVVNSGGPILYQNNEGSTNKGSGNIVRNNLFYNTNGTVNTSDGGVITQSNNITVPASAFKNFSAGDYSLFAPTLAGMTLASPFNLDILGRVRGSDGTWDIGAYEYTGTTGNIPPAVSLTAPTNNATYTAPASITLTATATDSDGTVSKVEFYNGTTLLNTDTTSPYSYFWTGVAAGSYSLTAKATDNSGAVTTSNPVLVTVTGTFTANLTVNGSTAYKVINGVGTNVNSWAWKNGELIPALNYLTDTLGHNMFRVVHDTMVWAGTGGTRPATILTNLQNRDSATLQSVYETSDMKDLWETIEYLNNKGVAGNQIIVSFMGYTAPWMGGSGAFGTKSVINSTNNQDMATMIASLVYYGHHRNQYSSTNPNLNFNFVSPFNEPDLTTGLEGPTMGGAQMNTIFGNIITTLTAMGDTTTKLTGPDTSNGPDTFTSAYSTATKARMNNFAWHAYPGGASAATPATARTGINADWMTETSVWCSGCDTNNPPSQGEWSFGSDIGDIILGDIVNGFTNVLTWEAFDTYYFHHNSYSTWGHIACKTQSGGGCSTSTSPRVYSIRDRAWPEATVAWAARPGMTRIGVTPTGLSNLSALSFHNSSTGQFSIVGHNTSGSPQTLKIKLDNLPNKQNTTLYTYFTNSSLHLAKQANATVTNGTLTVTVPGSTFYLISSSLVGL